ncbi:acyl-CoA dehydrogenase [Pseudobdellovibrio exovorus]|uniref:Acyl-coenzyme A dehydrogenase n=1 Tax=Pseudobdellovibrio exovorus JSS TaxID=1184267 RepID=M4VAW3_9BACT|nr:acyl-CoA dehydrogenase [Pseudobdellovibrio exovorus]AGH95610.1 acyl-CoA dehydrogenase [Pseudobdellovibrio exovorus JSS]
METLLSYSGYFCQSDFLGLWILGSVVLLLFLGFFGLPLVVWAVVGLLLLFGFGAPVWLLTLYAAVMLVFLIKPIRTVLVSSIVMRVMKKLGVVPSISATERTALEAGVVWVEKDLFSGKPNFKNIMAEPYAKLTQEEQDFMNGPVEELCKLSDPWKIWKNREVPQDLWKFIREKGFLGMIIPKEYGGLGFSAMAHSEVVMKIASRSLPTSISVMVPNSLGPAELLIHYGTQKQKDHWLPRLAKGDEIPCFGLTEPLAGSDAGSITSSGVVFKGDDGKLYIKLNWKKRWITLAGISTVIGLAFRLRDPENLLGKGEDIGITCALIPSSAKGVDISRRHDPLTIPFHNCPTTGVDVVVPLEDAVVGGSGGCGQGWSMLMECLAAGRGISLPAQSTGGAKLAYRTASSHSLIRKQFGVSIGKFEGVEEPLARIGASTYALEAMRRFTLGALDKGIKPPVVTAMMKYQATEMGRRVVNDAMDIMGGAGISLGHRNLIAEGYVATPIGITVEGANIMTRTLIIFGQGALRCHPFAFDEVSALESGDTNKFDTAFWGHIGHVVSNACRSILLSLSRGYLACAPSGTHPKVRIHYRRLTWASATFAILADIAMGSLGGQLKMKEKITGRFADIFSNMYMSVCVLRRFKEDGQREEDLPYVQYFLKYSMAEIQKGFDGLFDNLKIPGLRWFFKGVLGAWSRINSIGSQATDGWSHLISNSMMYSKEQRDRLTDGIYWVAESTHGTATVQSRAQIDQTARLENAFVIVTQAENAERKIRSAIKSGAIPKKKGKASWDDALAKQIISQEEYRLLSEADQVRYDAILVDDYNETEYQNKIQA